MTANDRQGINTKEAALFETTSLQLMILQDDVILSPGQYGCDLPDE